MKVKVIRINGGRAIVQRGESGWHYRYRVNRRTPPARLGELFVYAPTLTGFAWASTLHEVRQQLHRLFA